MKSACIVLQQKIKPSNDGVNAVLGAFSTSGYAFDDVQFLLQTDENSIKESLQKRKDTVDLLLVLGQRDLL